MVQSGNKYKSIVTGDLHSCAIQVNGLLDCWGDNSHFQLTGNTNPALFITVNSKIPLLTGKAVTRVAAGQTSTCAENSDNNTVCWGKPSRNVSNTARNPGFVALAASSATSLATEVDDCGLGFQNCARDLSHRRLGRSAVSQLGRFGGPRPAREDEEAMDGLRCRLHANRRRTHTRLRGDLGFRHLVLGHE